MLCTVLNCGTNMVSFVCETVAHFDTLPIVFIIIVISNHHRCYCRLFSLLVNLWSDVMGSSLVMLTDTFSHSYFVFSAV